MSDLASHQEALIRLLITSGVLRFGDFLLKSGRRSPYFLNFGTLCAGKDIQELGIIYATHIRRTCASGPTIIFGPAYKGIPLAVSTSQSLATQFNQDSWFLFNRKEQKQRGEGGFFVGRLPTEHDRVVIVEDVITGGTTLNEVLPLFREHFKAIISGIIIAVDRCERPNPESDVSESAELASEIKLSAVKLIEEQFKIPIYPIVTIYDILSYVKNFPGRDEIGATDAVLTASYSYLARMGANPG